MNVESGQLQRLTDQQVSARLGAYNAGGSLDRDIEILRDNAGDIVLAAVQAQFGPERAERFLGNYTNKVDSNWIQNVAEYGRQIVRENVSVPVYMAARAETATRIVEALVDRLSGDPAKLQRCLGAFYRLSTFETDIILAQVSLLEAIDAADQRGRESGEFERHVAELVRASTDQS
ncbi:MAG TPA: protoglobin domain-containing protein, partial [Sphingomicrobium sp.]|nr:protoglobin domain-containing protein [Sphingomicrobium sp.]